VYQQEKKEAKRDRRRKREDGKKKKRESPHPPLCAATHLCAPVHTPFFSARKANIVAKMEGIKVTSRCAVHPVAHGMHG
jgi:hypothetical protein